MTTPDNPNHRPRDGSGRFTRSIDTVRRDAACTEYLAENPGTTYEELARRFGYYDKGEARRGVLRAKADVARPAVTKLLADESTELDALYTEAVAILQRHHITVSHGRIVTWLNPATGAEEPLQDDGPRLQAIQVSLRVRESYRKLHGLDQPAQVAVSGGVKYEVVGVDPTDLT
ncbi:hypothetical protein ABZ650_20555 [Streptomyces griseoviridis]|uniref:hypothetical protein n=1 Tax=Streptomyces griseoviridis TaxID=45398 RepID=UPI00340163CB